MNRRDALKSLAAVPLVGMISQTRTELIPLTIVGVEETPHLRGKIKVLLNGEEVKWCKRASITEGWADHYVDDKHGRKMFMPSPDGTVRSYGHVSIVPLWEKFGDGKTRYILCPEVITPAGVKEA